MKATLLLILFLISACASYQKKHLLKLPSETPPGHGLLFIQMGNKAGYCNGTMISRTHFLTNAHCLQNASVNDLVAVIKTSQSDVAVDFSEIIYQSKYPTGHDFSKLAAPDYALLKVNQNLNQLTPVPIKRMKINESQTVHIYSLELQSDEVIHLIKNKCTLFRNNMDADFESGLSNMFLRGTNNPDDCRIREGHSGSAIMNHDNEIVGILRQLEDQKMFEDRRQGNYGIATNIRCLKLFDQHLDKKIESACSKSVIVSPLNRLIKDIQKHLQAMMETEGSKLSEDFKYLAEALGETFDQKTGIFTVKLRFHPACAYKLKADTQGELRDVESSTRFNISKFGYTLTDVKTKYSPYGYEAQVGPKSVVVKIAGSKKTIPYCDPR